MMAVKRHTNLICNCQSGEPEMVPFGVKYEFNGGSCKCEAFTVGTKKHDDFSAKVGVFRFRRFSD